MEKFKVVIADDIRVLAENCKQIAETFENIEVVGIASNGQEEYNMILEYKPDLVITDNQMPEKNGIEVVELINNNSSILNKPKFILVTGDTDSAFLNKAYNLGVLKVVSKMSVESSLKYVIEEFLYLQNKNESVIMETHQVKKKKSLFEKFLNLIKE
jgi:YesN/AraC family two-component response regulator